MLKFMSTEDGIVISLREVHPLKFQFPIDFTVDGKFKLSNNEQFSKAENPTVVTFGGISK